MELRPESDSAPEHRPGFSSCSLGLSGGAGCSWWLALSGEECRRAPDRGSTGLKAVGLAAPFSEPWGGKRHTEPVRPLPAATGHPSGSWPQAASPAAGSAAAECAESLTTGEFPLRLGDVLKDHPGPATCGQLSPASPGGEQLWLCTCVVRAGALDRARMVSLWKLTLCHLHYPSGRPGARTPPWPPRRLGRIP